MYLSKFNKTMSKSNEDFLEIEILEISNIDFFCLDNNFLHINNHCFETDSLTILGLSKIIESLGGVIHYVNNDYKLFSSRLVCNYSNYLFKEVIGSPIRLKESMYRFQDIDYEYQTVTDESFIINNEILMSKKDKTQIIKKSKRFRLFTNIAKYIGV